MRLPNKPVIKHFLFWLHIIIIALVYLSPWFLPWWCIGLLFILYWLQLVVFKGCIISQAQFGRHQPGFYYHYLSKIYPNIKSRHIDLWVDYIIPLFLILLAYILQSDY